MESAGNKSGAAGGGDGACSGGHLCHLCGYKYASAHPSAKQRRAHRKNCGGAKSPTAAAAAAVSAEAEEERQGKKLLLGDGDGEAVGGGEGNGTAASDSGGALPGSAEDVANAADDDGNGVHSSANSAGIHVIINDITSQGPPKANGADAKTEVDLGLTENALHFQDLYPSQSHASGDQHQDSSASHFQPEPEDGARFSPDFSTDEIGESNVVCLPSTAAAGEISAQTIATVGCPDDTATTENDCMTITIDEDKTGEGMLVKGNEIDSSYQENLQTKIDEGHSATTVEEDLCVNNLDVVPKEQNPSEDSESKDESGVIGPNPVEQVCTIKEPVDVLGDKEPSTDDHVRTNDTGSDELSQFTSGGCHLEAADVAEMQQQIDSTSLVADQLTSSKRMGLEEGPSYPGADEVIQAVSSATEPAVGGLGAEVISAGSVSAVTKEDTSEVTTEDDTQNNSSHTSVVSSMPSQIDPIEPSIDPTSHEINMNSKHDVDENEQIENISADVASRETNDLRSTDNIEEIKQIEEISAEDNTLKINILQSASSVEKNEQIEEVIADPASDNINRISSRDVIVQKEQSAVYMGTAHEINGRNIPAYIDLVKQDERTTADPTAYETKMTNITDEVEEKKQNEEITPDLAPPAVNLIHENEDKMQNEDMAEVPSSHKNVVDGADFVEEKDEETMSEPTSHNTDAVSIVDVVEGKKQKEEVTLETVKGKQSEEPILDPTAINAGGIAGTILVVDSSLDVNNTPQGTDDAKEEKQNEKGAADDARADDVVEKKQKEETATETNTTKQKEETAKETNTRESANDHQNEEITDKEMTIDSDKSHVSLKSLLSEKGMEVKEKKAGTKDRVLSFRRRSSKDNPSPTKPGSEQQDWNSPARLPVEKSPKGKKQPWRPFICCHSMN